MKNLTTRLEIIIGDPKDPEFHTVTTIDYFLYLLSLRPNVPIPDISGIPTIQIDMTKQEAPEILRIRSSYQTQRDYLRADYEDQIRLKNIAERKEIENLK